MMAILLALVLERSREERTSRVMRGRVAIVVDAMISNSVEDLRYSEGC